MTAEAIVQNWITHPRLKIVFVPALMSKVRPACPHVQQFNIKPVLDLGYRKTRLMSWQPYCWRGFLTRSPRYHPRALASSPTRFNCSEREQCLSKISRPLCQVSRRMPEAHDDANSVELDTYPKRLLVIWQLHYCWNVGFYSRQGRGHRGYHAVLHRTVFCD